MLAAATVLLMKKMMRVVGDSRRLLRFAFSLCCLLSRAWCHKTALAAAADVWVRSLLPKIDCRFVYVAPSRIAVRLSLKNSSELYYSFDF